MFQYLRALENERHLPGSMRLLLVMAGLADDNVSYLDRAFCLRSWSSFLLLRNLKENLDCAKYQDFTDHFN